MLHHFRNSPTSQTREAHHAPACNLFAIVSIESGPSLCMLVLRFETVAGVYLHA